MDGKKPASAGMKAMVFLLYGGKLTQNLKATVLRCVHALVHSHRNNVREIDFVYSLRRIDRFVLGCALLGMSVGAQSSDRTNADIVDKIHVAPMGSRVSIGIAAWRNMNINQFRIRFNDFASVNGIDKLSGIEAVSGAYTVIRLDGLEFDRKADAMQRASIIPRGRYQNLIRLIIKTDASDRLVEVSVDGSKADPINRKEFNDVLCLVFRVLTASESNVSDDRILTSLGLTQKEGSEPIGQTVTVVVDQSKTTCLYQPKNGHKGVACVLVPLH